MREHARTLTPTLSLSEGEGAISMPSPPPAPPRGGGGGGGGGEAHDAECVFMNDPRYGCGFPMAAIAAAPRFLISSGLRSSVWVASPQTWPKGSVTLPNRSPQNMSAGGIEDLAPASSARLNAESTSGTYRKR